MSSLTTRLSIENQSAAAVITLQNLLLRIPGVELLNATLARLISRSSLAAAQAVWSPAVLSEDPGNGVTLLEASGDTSGLLLTSHSITINYPIEEGAHRCFTSAY
jgi:hypothetical protein